MTQQAKSTRRGIGGFLAAAVLPCLIFAANPVVAQDDNSELTLPPASTFSPFIRDEEPAEVVVGNAANAPMRLQLNQPFSLQQFSEAVIGQSSAASTLSSGMNYRIADGVSLSGGLSLSETSEFQSVGSIHCENGVMDAVSYRAANCYFIDDTNSQRAGAVALGANFQAGNNARASINMFREQRNSSASITGNSLTNSNSAIVDPLGLGLMSGNRLLGGLDPVVTGPGFAASERTGVDVEFQVGFSTDQAGDMVLGLQLTRILDSGTEGVFYASPGASNWTIAKPYDSARLSLDWNRGPFSGGVDSYYRSPVSFINRSELDRAATFDVHFTWRAPWNASLSVGASNVLGSGTSETTNQETNLVDPLESIYGRIPYVRYKQDL